MRLFNVRIEGPLYEQWPSESHRALYGDYAITMENAEAIVQRFANRAFRRAVTQDETAVLVKLFDRRRGGLLGQASVLTASANGIDTSPVIRGIWILENILGTPPLPPPPDVEPIEPDIRGVTTIREQLRKHREVETCAECHRKIDPLGFALENFDPIGSWRIRYMNTRQKPMVDASGQLTDGTKFQDVVELKQGLLARKRQFAHCLTEKLMIYSLGRKLSATDRPYIDRIVRDPEDKGWGMRDLLLLIIESKPFTHHDTL